MAELLLEGADGAHPNPSHVAKKYTRTLKHHAKLRPMTNPFLKKQVALEVNNGRALRIYPIKIKITVATFDKDREVASTHPAKKK